MKSELKPHLSFSTSTPSSPPSSNPFETTSFKEKLNCLQNYKTPSPMSSKKKSISSTQARKRTPISSVEITTTTTSKRRKKMKRCPMWLICPPKHVVQFTNVESVNWLLG